MKGRERGDLGSLLLPRTGRRRCSVAAAGRGLALAWQPWAGRVVSWGHLQGGWAVSWGHLQGGWVVSWGHLQGGCCGEVGGSVLT